MKSIGTGGSARKPAPRSQVGCSSVLCHTVSRLDFTSCHFPVVGEDTYKAREEGSEVWGAAEVQEDEDTRVEVPLDQVLIEF